jgi:hypothetical protein
MRVTACWFVAVLVGGLAAQERREPVRGSAVDAAGAPWSGATVRLLSRPIPGDERFGRSDEVTVTSDAKGRFLVQLLPGRFYLAWAFEQLGDGRVRTSSPVEDVIAGRPLELVADAPRAPKNVRIEGLAAWQALGKVVVVAMSATSPAEVIALDADGETLRLPPLPGHRARVQVTCGGLPLLAWPNPIDLGKPEPGTVRLRAPRRVLLRIVDADKRPVVGAALGFASNDFLGEERTLEHLVGVTDAAGNAVVTLPIGAQRFRWHNFNFCITAPGFAPVRNIGDVDLAAEHDAAKGEPAATWVVPAGVTHTVRCRVGERPLRATVVVRTACKTIGENDMQAASNRLVATDAEGRLAVSRRPDAGALLLAAAADLPVPAGAPAALHPVALLGVVAAGEARPELEFDAARLCVRTLSVLDASGTPVDAAHVAVMLAKGDNWQHALTAIGTGRDGRAAVLVPAGLAARVVAWAASGWAVVPLTDGEADAPTVLRFAAATALPGRVVGADGAPVAFARVVSWTPTGRGDAGALAAAMGSVAATTARDGTFVLPIYEGVHYSLRGVTTADDEHYLDRSWIAGTDDPMELVLDLGKAR